MYKTTVSSRVSGRQAVKKIRSNTYGVRFDNYVFQDTCRKNNVFVFFQIVCELFHCAMYIVRYKVVVSNSYYTRRGCRH